MNFLFKLLFAKSFRMALKLLGVQRRRWGRMGQREGVAWSVQVVRRRKRSNWIYVGLIFLSLFFHHFIFALTLSINYLFFLSHFYLCTYHCVHSTLPLSAFPLISPPFSVLSLFSHPTLPVFPFRALFLGLSNNPHITDLHLDISSCEVRSVSLCCSRYIQSSSS